MRHILTLSILLLASAGAGLADDASGWSADAFSWWIGKYPTTEVNNKTVSILEEKPIKQVIERIIPPKEQKLLNTFDVEAPIKTIGKFMLINKCKSHNCPSDLAMIVIDLEKKRVWAGFFSRETSRVSTRWYGDADDYSVLPVEIQKEFLARHGN